MRNESISIKRIIKYSDSGQETRDEKLAVEAPMEIRLSYYDGEKTDQRTISVTMRTPGEDIELALGFLFTEGIILHQGQIKKAEQLSTESVLVTLNENVKPDLDFPDRNFLMNASCGVCGKTNITHLSRKSSFTSSDRDFIISPELLYEIQEEFRLKQELFSQTGGLHASALFTAEGELLYLFEDIGRHNALDKITGQAFLENVLPMDQHILLLSGRAGFELIQKAAMAGIRFIAAIGAPSDLAVQHAESNDITLVGFLRNHRMNIYNGERRLCFSKSVVP